MEEKPENEVINENVQENVEIKNEVQEQNVQETIIEEKQEEVIVEGKKKKGSYITGTIGAIIGGAIASIPWILTYTYANMIVAVLATLIAGGAFLGYKIFRGRIGKSLPAIITIVSLLVVTIVTTVICPTIFMVQAGYPMTLDNLLGLYSDVRAEIRTAIIEDLVISLLFTVIGIAAVVRSMSIQIKNGADKEKLQFNTGAIYEQAKKELAEQSEAVKKACTALNSMNKENTATKQEILNELEMTYGIEHKKAKQYFGTCVAYKLLRKQKGNYYYDETDEQTKIQNVGNLNTRRTSPKLTIVIIVVAIIIGIVIGLLSSTDNTKSAYTVPNTNIQLEISDSQVIYGTEEEIIEMFQDEDAASYYDFIIRDAEADKYDIYGQAMPKSQYEGYDFATIMQVDRDYYAQFVGEEATSEVLDKNIEGKSIKAYNYTYEGNDGNQYRAVIYLYEEETHYLWINIYADMDLELTQIDTLIEELIK